MDNIEKIELIVSTIVVVMAIGTITYHNIEKWNFVDSFYFTGITMTTIGYGDMHPTTDLSKIFTVFFAFAGVGVSLFSLSVIAAMYFEHRERSFDRKKNARKKDKIRAYNENTISDGIAKKFSEIRKRRKQKRK